MLTLRVLLWYKIKILFADWKSTGKTVLMFLFLFFVAFYGMAFAYLLDNSSEVKLTPEMLLGMVYTAIFVFVLVKDFFPAYKNVVNLFSRVYPVSYMKRWVIHLTYELFIPHTLFVAVFLLPSLLNSEYFTLFYYLQGIMYFLLAVIISRSIRFLIERRPEDQQFFVGGFLVFILLFIGLNLLFQSTPVLFYLNLGFLIILLVFNYFLERKNAMIRKINVQINYRGFSKLSENPLFFLAFKDKVIRNALLMAFLLKACFLSAFLFFPGLFEGMAFSEILIWLYISPMILVNSGLINLWGFHRPVWLSVELFNGKIIEIIKIHLQLTAVIFLLDFIITFSLLGFSGNLDFHKTIYYFSALIAALYISIWASIGKARSMEGSTTLRRNKMSISLMVLGGALTTLLILPFFHHLFYAGYIIIFLMLIYLTYELPGYYESKKHELYERLFKSGK